ncbi:hypothetical protein T492DRAFT_1011179 [Pavlovales sp. CCMP2436]|nr:hypothetical protein T492DRAFT_1011179 [Pavlovales sp. CCMP2436]
MSKGSALRAHLVGIERRVLDEDKIIVIEACLCEATGLYFLGDCCLFGQYNECCCCHCAMVCKPSPAGYVTAPGDAFNCACCNWECFKPVCTYRYGAQCCCLAMICNCPVDEDVLPLMCAGPCCSGLFPTCGLVLTPKCGCCETVGALKMARNVRDGKVTATARYLEPPPTAAAAAVQPQQPPAAAIQPQQPPPLYTQQQQEWPLPQQTPPPTPTQPPPQATSIVINLSASQLQGQQPSPTEPQQQPSPPPPPPPAQSQSLQLAPPVQPQSLQKQPQPPASVKIKAQLLRTEMGIAPDVPIVDVVGRCEAEIGIVVALGSTLVQRLDACLNALGVVA